MKNLIFQNYYENSFPGKTRFLKFIFAIVAVETTVLASKS